MSESIILWFEENLPVAPIWIIFIVSMIPIVELRGALLAAGPLFGIDMWQAAIVSILGNMVPIPFILWFITPIFNWMKKTKRFRPMVEKLEKKSMGKSDQIQKYEFTGLMLFVGVPLPGTGAWTGALIASLLGIDLKKALLSIFLGVCLAAVIMCVISYGIPWLITLF